MTWALRRVGSAGICSSPGSLISVAGVSQPAMAQLRQPSQPWAEIYLVPEDRDAAQPGALQRVR
jgi:hypothetical protein